MSQNLVYGIGLSISVRGKKVSIFQSCQVEGTQTDAKRLEILKFDTLPIEMSGKFGVVRAWFVGNILFIVNCTLKLDHGSLNKFMFEPSNRKKKLQPCFIGHYDLMSALIGAGEHFPAILPYRRLKA